MAAEWKAVSGLPNPILGASPHSTESTHLESGLTISALELLKTA